jgi:hypothetical protein
MLNSLFAEPLSLIQFYPLIKFARNVMSHDPSAPTLKGAWMRLFGRSDKPRRFA